MCPQIVKLEISGAIEGLVALGTLEQTFGSVAVDLTNVIGQIMLILHRLIALGAFSLEDGKKRRRKFKSLKTSNPEIG